MKRPLVSAVLAIVLAGACEPPPPVKSASGERIESISYEERFPLSTETHEVTFYGDRLRRVVAMLDRHGVTALSGDYAAAGVLDKSTLVLEVHTGGSGGRKLLLKNCAEPRVCAFFAEAVSSGVVEKLPVVCRDPLACTKK